MHAQTSRSTVYASWLPIPDSFWVMWEGPPYCSHSFGDGSKCRSRKGLKTVCIAPTRTSDVFDMKKAIAIKLNDHVAKITDGSCPSHHSPNDVILIIK